MARQDIPCVNDSLCEEVPSEACVYSSLKHFEFMASDPFHLATQVFLLCYSKFSY